MGSIVITSECIGDEVDVDDFPSLSVFVKRITPTPNVIPATENININKQQTRKRSAERTALTRIFILIFRRSDR